MAKVVLIPRKGDAVGVARPAKEGCAFHLQGSRIEFDCRECPYADDVPSTRCLGAFRKALLAHREATGMVMRGPCDVWIRENGVESLRALLAAEMAWEGLRSTLISLPCPRPIMAERVERYMERARCGCSDLFCSGVGDGCANCLEIQREAVEALRSGGTRARRTLAVDRFRITDVSGGKER